MSELICPVCGSKNLVRSTYQESVQENLGGSLIIEKVLYHCQDCDSEGDFFGENDKVVEETLISLKDDLIVSVLDEFIANKVSLSSIERALDLPQRTLTKWKNKISSPTATGVALFKYLKLFPWMLDVAEEKYGYDSAQKIFMNAAFQQMINKLAFSENEFKNAGIFTNANSAFLYIHIQKKDEPSYVGNKPMITIT